MSPAAVTVLQALRAGPIETAEANERWAGAFGYAATQLTRLGYAVQDGDGAYRITDAGRAACPFRNPLAGKPVTPPEVFSMPHGKQEITRQQVHAAIKAAGRDGIHRKALIKHFDCPESTMDNHLMWLNRAVPPVIFKPAKGVVCDIAFTNETQHEAEVLAEVEQKPASTATDNQVWVTEPAAEPRPVTHDIHGTRLDVDHHEAADLPPASLAQQMAQIGGYIPTIVEDINVADPKDVEFAIYSSGSMDMHFTDLSVTLQPPVLAKLRGFLGLFQEAV